MCLYTARWMMGLAGWDLIIAGAVSSGASLNADGTIIGIPIDVILGLAGIAVGTSGGFVLWYADTYFTPGWYCG